jgi:amino acid transporter
MDLSEIIDSVLTSLVDNPLITITIAILLIIMLFRKPKIFFMIFLVTLLLSVILYVISIVSSTGVSQKKELIHKSTKDLPQE